MRGPESQLTELFQRANALQRPELERFLVELRRESPAIADELEQLLEFDARGGALSTDARVDGFDARAPEPVSAASAAFLKKLAELSPPTSRYTIQGEIGSGGQGAILRVWDETLRRQLAMKVVLGKEDALTKGPTPPVDERTLGRFLEEAQVTGQLDHPGVVPVHELAVDDDGRVYFTMRLVKGADLSAIFELVRAGKEGWSQTRAVSVILKVCETMSYAHSKGVIHRDLKPANIMVGKYGEVYVMDWGLAKVRGRKDEHDLRLKPANTGSIHSERADQRVASPDSPLVTMDGTVMGTPAFMPLEQAEGRVEELGPRSDVYGVGAMLYQLLTGEMPYVPAGARLSPHVILAALVGGPPKPIHVLNTEVPAELAAICEKAMARKSAERYADMQEMADDLRAYLEHRVVKAYQTGALVELRKWVERNRALAGSLVAGVLVLVAGLASTLVLKANADAHRAEALRLSAFQRIKDLTTEADQLWPVSQENMPRFETWLGKARELAEEVHVHEAALDRLRERAAMTDEEREHRLSSDPRLADYQLLAAKLQVLRKAQDVREGKQQAEVVTLAEGFLPEEARNDALTLNYMAFPLTWDARTTLGQEATGVALSRMALDRATDDLAAAKSANTLAMGLYGLGLDEEALEMSALAVEFARSLNDKSFKESDTSLRNAIEHKRKEGRADIEAVERELAALKQEIGRTSIFGDEESKRGHLLAKVVEEIKAFSDGLITGVSPQHGWGVQRRRDFVAKLLDASVAGEDVRRRWKEAIASIRSLEECPLYRGLVIQPQLGLLPLGRDSRSGLWEFAHLQTGDPAARDADGSLRLTEESGLVFVLLPGGSFHLGCQKTDPDGPNYDRGAQVDEGPLRSVEISPFFLSKYELSQAIWLRATGGVPSHGARGSWVLAWSEAPPTLLHPADRLTWDECDVFLRRHGFTFPSEAQWEYAARAGTKTPWFSGQEPASLEGRENIGDAYARDHGGRLPSYSPWSDGYTNHAPVGTFVPNPFGLHDMLGNLSEYCFDAYVNPYILIYGQDLSKDRVVPQALSSNRIVRGGNHSTSPAGARCALRQTSKTDVRWNEIGLRPARSLDR